MSSPFFFFFLHFLHRGEGDQYNKTSIPVFPGGVCAPERRLAKRGWGLEGTAVSFALLSHTGAPLAGHLFTTTTASRTLPTLLGIAKFTGTTRAGVKNYIIDSERHIESLEPPRNRF